MSPLSTLRRLLIPTLAVSATVGGVAWGWSRYEAGALHVREVKIEGASQASEIELRHLADVRIGDSMLWLDLDRALAGVVSHPWVSDATVNWNLDGSVQIRVTEHETALLLAHRGLYRISEGGEVFARARSSDLDYPLLTGVEPLLIDEHGALAQRIVREALVTLDAIDACESLDRYDLSEIHFDQELGFTLRLRSQSIIHLGFTKPTERLERLDAIVRRGLDLSVPHDVDLDMPSMALVTPRAS